MSLKGKEFLNIFHAGFRMNIPFLDLKAQYHSIKPEIDSAILDILEHSAFVLGKSVSDFEANFAKALDVKHCVALGSGTAGNHLAAWTLGIGPGDEVIVPANTFIATAWGATLCGATPVFVDCSPECYNIDPEKIEKAITAHTKAIVAVHLFGHPADLDAIREITKAKNIHLIEDCAQAHFAEYKGKRVGGLSEIASFSFYPGKNLGAYGEGGAITTNNDNLAKKARMIRSHGAAKKYEHEIYGHNYRMEGIQGAVLGVKLKHLGEWTENRRKVAQKYNNMLAGVGDLIIPKEMPYGKHVYHLYVIQTAKRDALEKHLAGNGISTGMHYPIPLHLQPCFRNLGYKKGDCPIAEKLAKCGLSLPLFAEMSDEQLYYVTKVVSAFFKG
jgi:dTDP-4-amino-4,6-dideoxygalactose transaminase